MLVKDIKLSVIIPVYNEINTILEIIRLVKEEPHKKEIIIVDDCSTDGTKELLSNIKEENIKILFNERNRGKGYCIRRAIPYVEGDIVIIQDADLEYYPDEYSLLIRKIVEGKADAVYGSRFLGTHRVFYFYHYIGNKILNLITNIFLDTTFTDIMTCYKAFRTDVIKSLNLQSDRFGIEVDITTEVVRRGYRVYETPISYDGRGYEEGKKIRWKDFFVCLFWLFKARFRPLQNQLLIMERAKKYHRWIYQKFQGFVGKNVLEIGAGLGAISQKLLRYGRELTLIDNDKRHITKLKRVFGHNPFVRIIDWDMTRIDEIYSQPCFDTVVGINFLEHIQDDEEVLKKLFSLLLPKGRIILFVPQGRFLYSKLDRLMGHYRRYTKKELREKVEKAGFVIERLESVNLIGGIIWWFNFVLLKRKSLGRLSVCLFDLIVPCISFIEKVFPPFWGQSLFCIGEKIDG